MSDSKPDYHPLVAYAKLYLAQPDLRRLAPGRGSLAHRAEQAVTEFLGDKDWYPDIWPGRHLVLFFSWDETVGTTCTWSVEVVGDEATLRKLLK